MKKIYYFAYGSNMLFERINTRLKWFGDVKPAGTYTLKDWQLVLDCYSEWSNGCYANIVPSEGGEVEGVLYELNHRQMCELDRYEALYERAYFDLPDGSLGFTYVSKYRSTKWIPNLNYIDILIEGCLENKLIKTYNFLAEFRASCYRHKLPRGSKYKPIAI